MEKTLTSLQVQTKANDVDEKGRVTVAVNGIGIEDAQGDISMPGSFDATLKTDINRMKWLYNHDVTQLLGVPLEGSEKDGNLVMVGQLNMKKQLCRDVYTDYKLMAEHNRTLEHSVGVIAVRRDKEDRRKVHEWKMLEYSTLSFLGANPQTFLVDLKSATPNQVRTAIEFLQKALKQPEYSDKRLKNIDMELALLLKSLNGGHIATCPCCGYQFDYDSLPEKTFSEIALEAARERLHWITENTVRQEMEKLQPQIRDEVVAILDVINGTTKGVTEKGITDALSYVRCPNCYSRVYRTSATDFGEETKTDKNDCAEDPEKDEPEKENNDDKKETTKKSFNSFIAGLNNKI